jgi:hypothetical protein
LGQNCYSFREVPEVFGVAIGEAGGGCKVQKFGEGIGGPGITGFRYPGGGTGLITTGAGYGARRMGGSGGLPVTLQLLLYLYYSD